MNLSIERFVANDGSGLSDCPDYVADALAADRRVGWQDGLPLVPAEGSPADDMELGDDVSHLYQHYPRGSDLLLPDSGTFLEKLAEADEVGGVSDISDELNTDEQTVRKALDLHQIDTPSAADDGADDDGRLKLPSGETVPFDPLHPLVVAQLLSDGLSFEESARYLSREADEPIEADDIRAVSDGLDGDDDSKRHRPRRDVEVAEGGYASSPWP
ncbi:hypothetical protein [Haloarcula laminariae]|uniref:hypothetical protein n=1 Tax=Haloarcula laminariae TaxID=2961577 RepID=UPI002406A589|nr:hypothetical protein [Halomicroarcula sp. FL173]